MLTLIPQEIIERKIFLIRGHKVMLSNHLAQLYGVTTSALAQSVRRNAERFPKDCVPRTYTERRFDLSSMVLCER